MVRRVGLATVVAAQAGVAEVVGVLVLEPAQRVRQFVRADQRGQGVVGGGGRQASTGPAVGLAVGQGQDLPVVLGHPGDQVGGGVRGRGVHGQQPLQGGLVAAVEEAHPQRGVAPLPSVGGVAVDAGLGGGGLHHVDVEVVTVGAEGFDAPLDVEVPFHLFVEVRHLLRRIAVAQQDEVEPFGGVAGDLDRDDLGAVEGRGLGGPIGGQEDGRCGHE